MSYTQLMSTFGHIMVVAEPNKGESQPRLREVNGVFLPKQLPSSIWISTEHEEQAGFLVLSAVSMCCLTRYHSPHSQR
jgi:hypothetical protein